MLLVDFLAILAFLMSIFEWLIKGKTRGNMYDWDFLQDGCLYLALALNYTFENPLELKSCIYIGYQWACLTYPISLSRRTKIPCISLFRPANFEASINHVCNFNSNTKEFPTHGWGCIVGINQLQRPK